MIGRSIILGRNILNTRSLTKQIVRHGSNGGIPGENLPFQLKNIYRLTAWFTVYFGSGLAIPFLVVRHQLKKQ